MKLEEVFGLIIVGLCYGIAATCDIICGTGYLAQVRETEKRL